VVEEKISHLQVSVRNIRFMKVLHCAAKLDHEPSNFWYRKTSPFLHHIHHRTIRTQVKDNVCTLFKSKCSMKATNMWVSQFGMNLELGTKLEFPSNQQPKHSGSFE
jgi:hypothetical protein